MLDSNFESTLDLLGLKINGTALLPTTEAQPPSILECLKFNPFLFRIVIQHCYSELLIELLIQNCYSALLFSIVDRIVDSKLLIEYKIERFMILRLLKTSMSF